MFQSLLRCRHQFCKAGGIRDFHAAAKFSDQSNSVLSLLFVADHRRIAIRWSLLAEQDDKGLAIAARTEAFVDACDAESLEIVRVDGGGEGAEFLLITWQPTALGDAVSLHEANKPADA